MFFVRQNFPPKSALCYHCEQPCSHADPGRTAGLGQYARAHADRPAAGGRRPLHGGDLGADAGSHLRFFCFFPPDIWPWDQSLLLFLHKFLLVHPLTGKKWIWQLRFFSFETHPPSSCLIWKHPGGRSFGPGVQRQHQLPCDLPLMQRPYCGKHPVCNREDHLTLPCWPFKYVFFWRLVTLIYFILT